MTDRDASGGDATAPVCVLVDGQCPICALYARHARSAADPAALQVLDARLQSEHKTQAQRAGHDLDRGMATLTPEGIVTGREAMIWLSRHLDPGGSWLLRLCARLFRHRALAVLAYPVFKAVRRTALWIKGVGPLR